MEKLDQESVDCIITSPPYWQLRDYGYPEQWGLEPTYQEYLEHLWQFMDECKRVLKKTCTCWVNLGDTYGGFKSGNTSNKGTFRRDKKDVMPAVSKQANGLDKTLLLLPHRFAIGCIDRGWIMRNDIVWAKRNGMPESCQDRFSKKHEYFMFMAKNQKYYFDLDGIRDKHKGSSLKRNEYITTESKGHNQRSMHPGEKLNENGKNPGSVSDFWDITTKGSSEKHYASFNFKFIEKCIVAGCPEFVCKKCGKPRDKIIKSMGTGIDYSKDSNYKKQIPDKSVRHSQNKLTAQKQFKGWTDCGCNAGFEGGTILDPFCGTGTTLVRALQLNRKVVGIDASKEYCRIAEKNLSNEVDQLKIF